MNEQQHETQGKYASFKKAFILAKDYFLNSDDKLAAWLLFGGAVLSVIALVALTSVFSWWTVGFWAALTAKNLVLFMSSMKTFALVITAYVAVTALKNYFVESLCIRWRSWLTQNLLNKYIDGDTNYLDLTRAKKPIANPEQRIQQDALIVVNRTINLSFDFLKSSLSLVTFIGTLWVVGGALSISILGATITIPGYLVWVALATAASASFIAQQIGKPLISINQCGKQSEAELRKDIESVNNNAESIAQEHGTAYYKNLFMDKLKGIYTNAYNKLFTKTQLVAFQSFYSQISYILPYLIAAPVYFAGSIDLGQLMQIGFAFSVVNNSLSWFVNSYETQAELEASVERLAQLIHALEGNDLKSTHKAIKVHERSDSNEICTKQLSIALPSSTQFIINSLNIRFKQGENVLIKGPSGRGKSTLLKAMAEAWAYGTGEIHVPSYSRIYFLPQKPSIPTDTLKAVLAYPDSAQTYTDAQYIKALTDIGGMEEFLDKLECIEPWSARLSTGEQQRLSFARALLKEPDWLFLDEATSALDAKSEHIAYSLIKNQLPRTTIISIAHKPTLGEFHPRVIQFNEKKQSIGLQIEDVTEHKEDWLDGDLNHLGQP